MKYYIPLKGKYNRGVYSCPECDVDLLKDSSIYGSTFDNTIGIANSNFGTMQVVECPKCFHIWYSHLGKQMDYFLESIELGTNKHFNNQQIKR